MCVCVFKEELSSEIKVREDLMSNEFPSIWLEVKQNTGKNLLVGGYYREWSKNGKKSEKELRTRLPRLEVRNLISQICILWVKRKVQSCAFITFKEIVLKCCIDPYLLFEFVTLIQP